MLSEWRVFLLTNELVITNIYNRRRMSPASKAAGSIFNMDTERITDGNKQ